MTHAEKPQAGKGFTKQRQKTNGRPESKEQEYISSVCKHYVTPVAGRTRLFRSRGSELLRVLLPRVRHHVSLAYVPPALVLVPPRPFGMLSARRSLVRCAYDVSARQFRYGTPDVT